VGGARSGDAIVDCGAHWGFFMPIITTPVRALRLTTARLRTAAIVLSVLTAALACASAQAANSAPKISGTPPPTAKVGVWYNFVATASDPDGNPLKFSIQNKPAWLVFNTTSGRLSATPTTANVGTYSNIIIRVSDGSLSAALPAFSIVVSATGSGNQAPKISGTPPTTAKPGVWYNFLATASDPDGDPLKFSIQNKPAWLVFNTSSGRLSATPTTANVGTYSNIIIKVSDGHLSAALPAFSIVVSTTSSGNRAPTISGTPIPSVVVGNTYAFTPTAADPDGNALTFSIANKPAWGSFNTSSGRLSGTPTSSQVGTYSNIGIKVSDGKATASLPAFSIAVISTGNGSATLSWTPPTRNSDGSVLTNLAGYRINYGTSAGAMTRQIQVANAGITRYVVDNLSPATWYFSVRSYNSSGVASDPTGPVTKTVR
jgi:hypothetical protein